MKKGTYSRTRIVGKLLTLSIITFLILSGCGNERSIADKSEASKEETINVFTSFYPYYDFAKQIGGERAEVSTVVPSGTEPHSFEPSPKMIANIEKADIFIYNGLGMEPWLGGMLDILNKKDVFLIDASKFVEVLPYKSRDDHEHEGEDHNYEEDHDHGEYDPHIWVDPVNALKISEGIKEAFVRKDPQGAQYYEENYKRFSGELKNLDQAFQETLKHVKQRKILVSHSAFGYLAHRYNIEELAVAGISPHGEPSPKGLAMLTKVAQENDLKYIFFEVLSNPKTAEVVAREAGLEVLTLYNIEGLTEQQQNEGANYLSLMYENLKNLEKALVK